MRMTYEYEKQDTVVKFLAVLVNIFDIEQIFQQENHFARFGNLGRQPSLIRVGGRPGSH